MKFLQTIRFDPSDTMVFEQAAPAGEWAIAGGFMFSALNESTLQGKTKQAFSNGFLSLESFGFSTFVTVQEINDDDINILQYNLANHLISALNAPSQEAAIKAANEEIQFNSDLCQDVALNCIFTLSRTFGETGEIKEAFRIVRPAEHQTHARVWEIIEEE